MPTPVVFIHGLWLHADSWKPWIELFRAAGYNPIAPGWPGEPATVAESNAHPERLANVGIDDVVEHDANPIPSSFCATRPPNEWPMTIGFVGSPRMMPA